MMPHRTLLTAALLSLAACASDPLPSPTATTLRPGVPPEAMGGRWVLAAAGASQCNMTFGAGASEFEGTIAPEGGCPGNFFTSRKWTFEQGSLVIRDHTGTPLAREFDVATVVEELVSLNDRSRVVAVKRNPESSGPVVHGVERVRVDHPVRLVCEE